MANGTNHVQSRIEKAHRQVDWYADLVRRQEPLAKANPVRYARRLRWFAALAYGYIFLILFICLALVVGIVALMISSASGGLGEVKVLIVSLVIVWAILSSLFVKIEVEDGLVIERGKAPVLYSTVDAIASRFGAPKVDEIRITTEFNAAAGQFPRLGIFGFYRNILYLGMPLLLALSPDEMCATMAHEFGHFSGAHGKTGAWAYRINRTWDQLRENLHRRGSRGAWLFRWFFNWYAPRFAAISFALRRANEYEADAAAAQVAGAETTARMLMRLGILQRHLDVEFWEPYMELSRTSAEPPEGALLRLIDAASVAPDSEIAREALARSMRRKTDYEDTHPSLTDRLSALGKLPKDPLDDVAERLRAPASESAAQALFGDLLPQVMRELEVRFSGEVRELWKARHAEYRTGMGRLFELGQESAQRELTLDETFEQAQLSYEWLKNAEALPVIRAAQRRFPDDSATNFLLAQVLLDEKDPEGVSHAWRVVELEPQSREIVRRMLHAYYVRVEDEESAEAIRKEAFEESIREEADEEEAARLTLSTELRPPTIDEADRQELVAQLRKIDKLDAAYLVSRNLSATGQSFYYLVVFRRKAFIESNDASRVFTERLAGEISLPTRGSVMAPEPRKKWVAKLDRLPGARLV